MRFLQIIHYPRHGRRLSSANEKFFFRVGAIWPSYNQFECSLRYTAQKFHLQFSLLLSMKIDLDCMKLMRVCGSMDCVLIC
jgi:hypothetical protein